jgi:hypothetical protein
MPASHHSCARPVLHVAAGLLVAACASAPAAAPTPAVRTTVPSIPSADHTVGSAGTAADRAAVVAVMERLFAAMRTRDTAAIREILHPELRIFVPGEQNGEPVLRVSTADDFIRGIAAATAVLNEVAIEPEIRFDRHLATLWTYYEFERGDQFSHCGYDSFQLARGASGWRIIGLAYTVRADGCLARR